MPSIQCSGCGKSYNDNPNLCTGEVYCPHCGLPADGTKYIDTSGTGQINSEADKEKLVQANPTEGDKPQTHTRHYKGAIIAFVCFVCAVGIVALMFGIQANSLSSSEENALRIVQEYRDMLKNPDSLILRSDIVDISVRHKTDNDTYSYHYYFFTASGTNSYGGTVTSTVCFSNGDYLCDVDEFPETEELFNMIVNGDDALAMNYSCAKVALSGWRVYGEELSERDKDVIYATAISPKKIAKKLHVRCDID